MLPSPSAGPAEPAATQLRNQVVDVSSCQVLDSYITEFASHRLQNVFIAGCSGRPDFVARAQPIGAGLFDRHGRRLHVRACGYLALNLSKRRACFLLRPVATPQLFAFAVDDAGIDCQLVTNDRLARCASC